LLIGATQIGGGAADWTKSGIDAETEQVIIQ
jgi:hypothetical protein